MEIKQNSVGVVVVTYNRLSLLRRVIDSLLAQTRPVDHIYIVDNASTDGTAEYLSALDSRKISFKRMPTNTGGAGGFSHGMKWAFDEGHEWIWLMDDDVEPESQCLEALLRTGAKAKAVLPLGVADDGSHFTGLAMRVNLRSPFIPGFHRLLIDKVYPTVDSLPAVLPLQDITFEGPLIHRSIPATIGFPRADFFIGRDDTEYAIRVLDADLGPILHVKDAILKRLTSQRTSFPLWRNYYQWRNELIIRSAHWAHPLMRFRVRFMFLLRTLFRYLLWERSLTATRARIHAFLDSLSDRPLVNRYLPR